MPARCASCTSNRASCAAPADDTQSLIRAIVGDAVVAPDVPEALLMWNAAGWYCGPLARAKPAVVMRSQRRYDVLGSLLVGSGAPTYLAVTEVNGSSTDFRSPHGLHAWLSSRGYASVILPGPVSKSIHAVKGRLGGSVLAWRVDTVQLVGAAPSADPDSATLSAVYRHRRQCGHGVPPVRVGVVYGSHRRNGKAKAVQMVTMHAMRDEGVIMAGDYNVTPADGFQAAGRRRVQADTLFATLTGDGRPQSSLSLAAVVPLGHDHARGEHSRVCRTPRAVNSCSDGRGMPASDARVYMGTSTIDHAVVAGHERLAWSLQSRWLVCDGEGLVSDHEIIVVQRQPRSVVTDGRGIYRLPRYCLSKWTPKQHASYCAEIERAMRECTVAVDDREHAMGQLVSIALRAADVAISPITHRTAHQVARIGHAGGDASGLASQVARVRGVLDVVQRAARTSDAADAALNAATVGNSTYAIACRLRARAALADAAAREGLLYDARAAQYVGRHNRFLRGALSLRTATSAPSTYSQVLPVRRAVVSRLQRELQYYGGKHSVLRRRQDEPVIRGVQAARDAPDPAAARDAIIQAMSQRSQRGQHGIRGFYTGDDAARGTWVGEAAATRRGIGEIYRAIDDDNHGHGVCAERVVGFFSAFCSDMWPELCAHDGDAWTLPAVCAFPDYQRSLSQLHGDKAVSLDRISKEMIEAAPTAFQHLCYQASMAIATPHDDGSRSQPALWSRIPVQCLDKKKPSDEIKKKRDIALPSQMMKQQANLYFPAYSAVMPRLHGGNFGWTRGVAPRGAAMVASYAMDHAHLLRHLLIVVYADIQRFFPAMDRDFLILAQQWYGLPADVREATRSLYENACMLYETAHGLADFCFDTLHMTTGRVQGCRLSTEEAKIFLSSLAEAIDVVAGGSGVRFWCGAGEGTRRIASVFCADDVAGMLTSWSGSSAFVAILDEWATVSASVCGIDLKECSKTTYSALMVEADGTPSEAVQPDDCKLVLHGVELPRLPISGSYTHIGDRRCLNGDQRDARDHVVKLCHAWLARVQQIQRCNQRTFAEYTNSGLSSIVESYSHCCPLTYTDGERVERTRRQHFRMRFRGATTAHTQDRYLPASWQPTRNYGRVSEESPEVQMVGDGWHHVHALSDAGLHAATVSALAEGIDTPLRFCARSVLDLLCYMGGMRGSNPAVWEWDHLREVLGRRIGANRTMASQRVVPMERWMVIHSATRQLMRSSELGVPAYNFTFAQGHEPGDGDPLDPHAPHHQPMDADTLEVFRGDLLDGRHTVSVLGRVRVPCWLLLSSGVVMRSHACVADGSRYMTPAEACDWIPELSASSEIRAAAMRAWTLLVSDLVALGVKPVRGEVPVSAFTMWHGDRAMGSPDGSSDMGARQPLDELISRMCDGDASAAHQWADAYHGWAARRMPRVAVARDVAAPTHAETHGPHTRYRLPPGGSGTHQTLLRGVPPPVPPLQMRTLCLDMLRSSGGSARMECVWHASVARPCSSRLSSSNCLHGPSLSLSKLGGAPWLLERRSERPLRRRVLSRASRLLPTRTKPRSAHGVAGLATTSGRLNRCCLRCCVTSRFKAFRTLRQLWEMGRGTNVAVASHVLSFCTTARC